LAAPSCDVGKGIQPIGAAYRRQREGAPAGWGGLPAAEGRGSNQLVGVPGAQAKPGPVMHAKTLHVAGERLPASLHVKAEWRGEDPAAGPHAP
jgi:hypothetical protein